MRDTVLVNTCDVFLNQCCRVAIMCRLAYVGVVVQKIKKHGISLRPLGNSSSCVLGLLDSRPDRGGTETSQVPR